MADRQGWIAYLAGVDLAVVSHLYSSIYVLSHSLHQEGGALLGQCTAHKMRYGWLARHKDGPDWPERWSHNDSHFLAFS